MHFWFLSADGQWQVMISPPQGSLNTTGRHLFSSLSQDGVFLSSHVHVLSTCPTHPSTYTSTHLHITDSRQLLGKAPRALCKFQGDSQPANWPSHCIPVTGWCIQHRPYSQDSHKGSESRYQELHFSHGDSNINSIWSEEGNSGQAFL